jgi:dolichol-phosphate mannosyltransferase
MLLPWKLSEMKLSIVIPLYNEIENIPKLQQEFLPVVGELVQSHMVEVIFVDDGSTDGTWHALDTFTKTSNSRVRFCIERHPENRGLGAALRTGFRTASGDVIITTDSDGSYKFAEIPALLSHLTPEVDIVTASPYNPDGKVLGVPAYRLILSRSSSLIYRLLVDWRIRTYTSLFRVYRREVIEKVSFDCDNFQAIAEILVKGMLLGYRVVEYPAILHKRSLGTSKVKLVRTITDHLRFQALVLLHRLSLKPIVGQDETSRA